ncbi:DUF1826 domain-containing protein [Acetobacter nitrogenifigens]|uniref:DUF1826 domain-containing protein n=1 Tax=Acetobacter nitrogenifigens DSM 23921 = NBRC 105050 TaxID=1120919 RepID=A0A511XEM1_9PROT|nr:DUF1826 domain-containing protein [Acetobacter nitrogenifigens]GEN61335.1 hypothetical protein ANI02nite_32190 [Acetobacter nitrogenifigens DSM 23921 = NBRC 105050]
MRSGCATQRRLLVPSSLREIERPDCHLAHLPRVLDQGLVRAVFAYLESGPELFLDMGRPEILETRLMSVAGNAAACLVDDILALVHHYRHLTGEDDVRLRLECIDHDSCRRFHVDNVGLRLLCTYIGPGVQWKRADDGDIHETLAGDIVILKGLLYPGGVAAGAVLHRSPPLSELSISTRRLLLTVDHVGACGMNVQQSVAASTLNVRSR